MAATRTLTASTARVQEASEAYERSVSKLQSKQEKVEKALEFLMSRDKALHKLQQHIEDAVHSTQRFVHEAAEAQTELVTNSAQLVDARRDELRDAREQCDRLRDLVTVMYSELPDERKVAVTAYTEAFADAQVPARRASDAPSPPSRKRSRRESGAAAAAGGAASYPDAERAPQTVRSAQTCRRLVFGFVRRSRSDCPAARMQAEHEVITLLESPSGTHTCACL